VLLSKSNSPSILPQFSLSSTLMPPSPKIQLALTPEAAGELLSGPSDQFTGLPVPRKSHAAPVPGAVFSSSTSCFGLEPSPLVVPTWAEKLRLSVARQSTSAVKNRVEAEAWREIWS